MVKHDISPLRRQGQADPCVQGQPKLYSGIQILSQKEKKENVYL